PCRTIAVLITLKPARAFPRDVTYIALAWISRGLRRTDAFGPHFDHIQQGPCGLRDRNCKARKAREFSDRSTCRCCLPIVVDEAPLAAVPLELLFDRPHQRLAFELRRGSGSIGWKKRNRLSPRSVGCLFHLCIRCTCNSLTFWLILLSALACLACLAP